MDFAHALLNGKKLGAFHLNTRHFFTAIITNPWNKLSRDMVESLQLEVFKIQLDMVLNEPKCLTR